MVGKIEYSPVVLLASLFPPLEIFAEECGKLAATWKTAGPSNKFSFCQHDMLIVDGPLLTFTALA